jgi:WD40 repeat protein
MRRRICFSMFLIFTLVSCAQANVNLIPTPTIYAPVSQSTPIPLVYEPITSENASSLALLAQWKIDSRAENIIFSPKQETLCAGKKNLEFSWSLFLDSYPTSKSDCLMPFPTNPFSKITISPNNHYSAEIRGRNIYIVDLQNLNTYLQFSLDDVVAVSFSASEQYLVIGFQNGDIWFVDKSEWLDDSNWLDLNPELKINVGKPPLQILFSSNDTLVAFLFKDQTIQVWSISSLSVFSTINEGNQSQIYRMAFSSNESILATAKDNLISLWDIKTGRLLIRLKGHQDTSLATSLVFSPTDRLIAALYDGYWVNLWGILPENLEIAKISSTRIANSIIDSTPSLVDCHT